MTPFSVNATKVFPMLAALVFAGALPTATFASDRVGSVVGRWKLTAALDASEITSIDEKEAAQLVGKIFTISKDKVQFGTRVCPPPDLTATWVEPNLYLREDAHASAKNLGLPNPVTAVELGCTVAFIKGKNRLVIHWDGWFFDARREPNTSVR